ncbi:DUF1134 domain-containing protein [Phenylobacterium sp.]|jgi:hypothetical protein|uniref:DUF1134 domain-containing protein n=1 Tax=Phenylobacterium sp. TaxID=1871053 RepID=UPI002F41C690
MDRRTLILSGLALAGSVGCASARARDPYNDGPGFSRAPAPPGTAPVHAGPPPAGSPPAETYSHDEIVNNISDFFGVTAEAAGGVVERTFHEQGQPTGYIAGEEASAAITVGARYGRGLLYMKGKPPMEVFWQGPSVGFDLGGNASRVFTLCYNLQYPDAIFQRFPGVEGSAYLVGGMGVNYQRAEDITLAPVRAGVGLRLGANLGYLAYTRKRNILPF